MKRLGCIVLLMAWLTGTTSAQPPDRIHYQGRLIDGTNLVNGVEQLNFRLFTAATGGTLVFLATDTVNLVDGLYQAVIGETVISGKLNDALSRPEVWLEVEVGGSPLTPRERLLSVPYARQVHGLIITTNNSSVLSADAFNSATDASLRAAIGGGNFNVAQGNYAVIGGGLGNIARQYATVAGGQFNQALEDFSTIGGGERNEARLYSVVGGGASNLAREVFAVVGGGSGNEARGYSVVSGGQNNFVDGEYGFIGGGRFNLATEGAVIAGGAFNTNLNASSFIGSGVLNTIEDPDEGGPSIIGSGFFNLITRHFGVIGGGLSNRVLGAYSVIPGGRENIAAGDYSFAGGRGAFANHPNSFVWAGQSSGFVSTTAENQFLVQADGGFGIGVAPSHSFHLRAASPSMMLENTTNTPIFLRFKRATDGASDHYIAIGSAGQMVVRVKGADRMTIQTNGFVGIGTANPTNRLHVAGNVQAQAFITGSDRNLKEDIQPVEPDAILAKVVDLPISTWSFMDDAGGTHLGPMAQDFHAAFGLGNTDTGIATVDADGVALAAIQALARREAAAQTRIAEMNEHVQRLQDDNAHLQEMVRHMMKRLERVEAQ